MIDDPNVIATKGTVINFGLHYDMSVRFYTTRSTPEVLALENINEPPCKYENDTYRLPNCKNDLLKKFFFEWCNCTPTLFFNRKKKRNLKLLFHTKINLNTQLITIVENLDDPRECQITDIKCVKEVIRTYCKRSVQKNSKNFVNLMIIEF